MAMIVYWRVDVGFIFCFTFLYWLGIWMTFWISTKKTHCFLSGLILMIPVLFFPPKTNQKKHRFIYISWFFLPHSTNVTWASVAPWDPSKMKKWTRKFSNNKKNPKKTSNNSLHSPNAHRVFLVAFRALKKRHLWSLKIWWFCRFRKSVSCTLNSKVWKLSRCNHATSMTKASSWKGWIHKKLGGFKWVFFHLEYSIFCVTLMKFNMDTQFGHFGLDIWYTFQKKQHIMLGYHVQFPGCRCSSVEPND